MRARLAAMHGAREDTQRRSDVIGYALAALFLGLGGFMVVRACGYEVASLLRYSAYFGLQIAWPGAVMLALILRRSVGAAEWLALGVPLGFGLEIFSFIAFSALHVTVLAPVTLLVFGGLAAWQVWRTRVSPVSWCWRGNGPRAALLALVGLIVACLTAAHLFAESPLVSGLPQRPVFHDWVYLLSRAAGIKGGWPFDDPSLAGTPLQYHYFLLVHVASASLTTGVGITTILLRLALLPVAAAVIAQAYLLGQRAGRSSWVGVAATALVFIPGELSLAADYDHLTYLGFFVQWLYVSPTLFFGVMFFGALLVALMSAPARGRRWFWLLVPLAATATAAKGSVLPVALTTILVLVAWTWIAERKFPHRLPEIGVVLALTFLVIYKLALAGSGGGDPSIEPFHVCRLACYWQEHEIPTARFLKHALHAPTLGTWLAWTLTGAGVLAGTAGVRLLGFAAFDREHSADSRGVARLLGAAVIASWATGLALHFDSNSELYFLFLSQLPLAALAAAGMASLLRRGRRHWRAATMQGPASRLATRAILAAALMAVACAATVQTLTAARCERRGFVEWLRWHRDVPINPDLLPMYDTMNWLRNNTEHDAVLVGNAFTRRNLGAGRGVLVDHTTVGVYYYYSALAERHVWIEGPTYAMNEFEARARLVRADQFFYNGRALPRDLHPRYAIIDHSLNDGARVPVEQGTRVFANGRFEVFRLLAPSRAPTT